MRLIAIAPVLALGLVAASAAVAHSDPSPGGGLQGSLSCVAGKECVYTVRNTGTQASYVPYGSMTFSWGKAHFPGGGCLKPGQQVSEIAFTHDGHGNRVVPRSTLTRPFQLPYRPGTHGCWQRSVTDPR